MTADTQKKEIGKGAGSTMNPKAPSFYDEEIKNLYEYERLTINRIENLKLMTFLEHASLHMKERHKLRRDALSIR